MYIKMQAIKCFKLNNLPSQHLQMGSDRVGEYGRDRDVSKFGTKGVQKWSGGPKTKVVGNCPKRVDMWSVLGYDG